MSVIFIKVWRDMANGKNRTLLVVLSTTVGVFAIGLVFGLSELMLSRMSEDHKQTVPAHITFRDGVFSQDFIDGIKKEKDVIDVEGEGQMPIRWRFEGEEEWRDGVLIARSSYEHQAMNFIDLTQGEWPARHALHVEKQSANFFNVAVGTSLQIEYGNSQRTVEVVGQVRMPTVEPPPFGGGATFYGNRQTFAWRTGMNN